MIDGINIEPVTAWLCEQVPDFKPPVRFELIAGGRSNLTFLCKDQRGRRVVLRRPPLGEVLQSAHDMGREHRIISALADSTVPVPQTFGLADAAVNGPVHEAPFFVMDYVPGEVFHDSIGGRNAAAGDRHGIGMHVIGILADLHVVDVDEVGLGELGRKEAYLERQLKRWTRQWDASKTETVPAMEESYRLLCKHMPQQVGAAIVHGDYRLGNMIVGDGRIQAILDWELCTLGDPLADLGYLLNNWVGPDELAQSFPGDISPTAVGGYPSRETLCDVYAERTGRDLAHINYYRAFSHWRLAAIGQGVFKRYQSGAMGQNHGVDVDQKRDDVLQRAESALALLS
jgi:aminoglycoside phosphotransferase (APT) family kinase protein